MVKLLYLDCGTQTQSWSAFQTHSYFLGIQPHDDYRVYTCRQKQYPSKTEVQQCQIICLPGSNFSIQDDYDWLEGVYRVLDQACQLEKFLIGFCFGHQLICKYFGAKIGTLPDTKAGTQGLVLNSLGQELIGHEYLLSYSYHRDYVQDLTDTRLISLCRFNNAICLAYDRQGDIKVLTTQVHPEFSFLLKPGFQKILDDLGEEPYIRYNGNIRKDYEKCRENPNCHPDNPYLNLETFKKHYLYDRDDPNKLYYMYQSSKWLRSFFYQVLTSQPTQLTIPSKNLTGTTRPSCRKLPKTKSEPHVKETH